MCIRDRTETDRERQTETDRETERETDRQTDRQIERLTDRQTHRIRIQPMYIIQLFINSYPDETGNSYADFVKPAK